MTGGKKKKKLTIKIRHRRRLSRTNPLPPIRQQPLLQKPKKPPHRRQRLRPPRDDIALLPRPPRIILPILLELRILDQGDLSRDELPTAPEDAAVNSPLLEELLEGFFRGRGGGERAGGEEGFELSEDEPRVAVDIAADGEDGDASVFDPLCEEVRLGRTFGRDWARGCWKVPVEGGMEWNGIGTR